MPLNLAILLQESALHSPEQIALLAGDQRITYRELNTAANRMANALRSLGVQPGENVAVMLPNIPAFLVTYFGILKMGATVVPLNVQFRAEEVAYHLRDSEAVAFFGWEEAMAEANWGCEVASSCRHVIVVNKPGSRALPERAISYSALMATAAPGFEMVWPASDDTAVILYTAGTTGEPKGAELTHFNLFANAISCASRLLRLTPEDIYLAILPFSHSFGQTLVMNAALYAGATLSLSSRCDAESCFEQIRRDKVTLMAAVPTTYYYLDQLAAACTPETVKTNLRLCVSVGAPLPLDLMERFETRFGVKILEGYGLSETSSVAAFNMPDRPRKAGSVGLPLWGTEIRLCDGEHRPAPPGAVGEIAIRGMNVMKGYYRRPHATLEVCQAGWFHTGDMARMDEDGYLYIVGRKKETILRGGFTVYPREVENVLAQHPAVADVAVIGVPDPALGEEITALVVLRPGQTVDSEELIRYCRERMAAYKTPRYIEFRLSLPKGKDGRPIRQAL